ncbi:cell wall protein [Curvularia clavata]|uniref:Cell wall protein n=1 Tax=Curvularia clavata TaxID=95742 RepID=A0A9Q8Z1L7_CURCL|nr:cell wall protein [Curvularia clavata]
MKFTTAALASSVAVLAAASPFPQAHIAESTSFGPSKLIAEAPGTDFDGLPLQAAQGGIIIGAEKQNASCGPEPQEYAVFQLNSASELSLYTANPIQVFYADVSGMGQGIIRYTTGAQQPSRYGERKGFTLTEEDNLIWTFPGSNYTNGFQACGPALGAKYSVWLDGVTNPAGYTNCKKFTVRAEPVENPVKCMYTE